MDGPGVAILSVLNQKYHQECDDGRAGIDDELPSVGIMKKWTCRNPHNDDCDRRQKGLAGADTLRGPYRKLGKAISTRRSHGRAISRFWHHLYYRLGSSHKQACIKLGSSRNEMQELKIGWKLAM
jgi:hypothetical protein